MTIPLPSDPASIRPVPCSDHDAASIPVPSPLRSCDGLTTPLISSCSPGAPARHAATASGLLAAALVLLCCTAGCSHRSSEDEASAPPPVVSVKTARVSTGDAVITVAATGRTDALKKEKIFTPVAGRLLVLKALEGTSFKEGDLMAVIRTKESQSAITGAEALLRGAATPEQEAEARKALGLAQSSQGTVELRAKFNGIVATRSVSEGELVGENGELFMLVDLATLVFVADVPLASLPSIHPGQAAAVRFTALPDRSFRGTVEAASPQTDPQSQTVKVRLRFSSAEGERGFALKTDMMGSAAIVTGVHRRALIVPRSAILRDDENNTSSVVTVGADSLARSVQVTVGATTDSTAEITGGRLNEGMTVVTEGNYALADSTRVTAAGMAAP